MELNITENSDFDNDNYKYDQIPENILPKKKAKVRFNQTNPIINKTNPIINPIINKTNPITNPIINKTNPDTNPTNKSILRKSVPVQKPKISYDDILSKMGMYVVDGQLHLLNNPDKLNQVTTSYKTNSVTKPVEQPIKQTGYIYNKYFNNEPTNVSNVRTPKTLLEYRNMLIQDIIQKNRIKQIKNTKLIMPNSNINFSRSGQDMNKLFKLSNRW